MKKERIEETIVIDTLNFSNVSDINSNLPTRVDSHIHILTSRIFVVTTDTNNVLIGIKHDDQILRTINGTKISLDNEEGTITAIDMTTLKELVKVEMQAKLEERITKKDLRELERIIKEIHEEKQLVKTSQKVKVNNI